jgi:hypothetical protein
MAYWTPAALPKLAQSESAGNPTMAPFNASNPSSSSAGLYGFLTGTWQDYAPNAGVNISQYPTANLAPADVQTSVALITPISHWTCPGCNLTASALALDPSNVSSSPSSGVVNAFSGGDTLTIDPNQPSNTDFAGGAAGPGGVNLGAFNSVEGLFGPSAIDTNTPGAIGTGTTSATGATNWFSQFFTTLSDFATRAGLVLVAIVILGVGFYAAAKGDLGQTAKRVAT